MAHLIAFSHLRWDFVFQRPQHLLTRMADTHPVIYVEEPVLSQGRPRLEEIDAAPGVTVLRPHTPVESHGFHHDQLLVIAPMLADYFQENGVGDSIAWFYTPMALPLLALFEPLAVVYDCMDELSAFKGAPQGLSELEHALIKKADVVFTGGISLYEAKRALHPNVHCQPSAVDVSHYAPERLLTDSPHWACVEAVQGHLPHPMLGYFGVIDERMNLMLLDAIARAHPEWSIVMVGPVLKIDQSELPRHDNIHWLGLQPYDRLPYLVKDWDVCLMPFALNEATQYISPTKTLEYLAADKPVVSTAIQDVVALYGDVVHVAHSKGQFIEICEGLLQRSGAPRSTVFDDASSCVCCFSWDDTAQAMLELTQQAMKKRRKVRRSIVSGSTYLRPKADLDLRQYPQQIERVLGSVKVG